MIPIINDLTIPKAQTIYFLEYFSLGQRELDILMERKTHTVSKAIINCYLSLLLAPQSVREK